LPDPALFPSYAPGGAFPSSTYPNGWYGNANAAYTVYVVCYNNVAAAETH
jgi:hypothetical protein